MTPLCQILFRFPGFFSNADADMSSSLGVHILVFLGGRSTVAVEYAISTLARYYVDRSTVDRAFSAHTFYRSVGAQSNKTEPHRN